MRISTNGFHQAALDGMLSRQADLATVQQQVTTGKRISSPADDPPGAVHILQLQRAQAENDQFGRNAESATARLNTEESALADVTAILQRVRELAIEANNAPLDFTARRTIAAEMSERLNSLVDIANRRDGSGDYMFAGYATTTQPFVRSVSGVNYVGDQGAPVAQIGPTQRVVQGHSGDAVFQRIIQGNGTFVTGVNPANTGTGIIDAGSVVNASAWVPDNYTLSFTSPTTYQITDGSATVVASGTYTSGNAIAFNGVQFTVTGAPVTGDTFDLDASRNEDIFTTMQNMIVALQSTGDNQPARAQLSTKLNVTLAQLDQADSHVANIRAEVGARLSSLDDAKGLREDFNVELQRNLSTLQDVDYAEAISRMNRQLLGLQAAQQSYSQITQLSLFNYL